MKIRIREGNDFDVVWAIKRAGVPEDLSTAINMKLTLVVYGLVIEHSLFTVTDNVLSINIPKEVATVNGDYRLVFEYTLPDAGQPDGDLKCKTDVVPFRIVPFTAKADDIYTINVTSDIAFGFKGDKGDDGDDAYQIWLDLGNVGTYEDFIAYLRQPAVDAGASISELEGEIQSNEGIRVQAENERDLAEGTRGQAENERLSAETIRQSNEGNRIEDEVIRVQNEAERVSKEDGRQSNEIDRIEAEGIRQSNEIDRIEAEGIRVQAEVERQITIQEAVTATNLANEKANLANDAAQNANEAAGLADTARTELTTAVNTKLGEADDKIEEMDTTLSTYEGRIAEVEGDIVQLAGDVSLLDAVQGAKIKDIENVLSTANLGQSAQVSVSGVSPLSLPKNAANGGMQVKLEGLTAENLFVDGKLITATSYSHPSDKRIDVILGNKYYARRLYQTISGTNGSATGRVATLLPAHDFVSASDILSRISTYNSASESNKLIYTYGPQEGTVLGEFRDVMIINLTATFGAGNEPDLATCDKMFSSYFEGIKNIVPTGRVRSVGKNVLDISSLKSSDFVALGGGYLGVLLPVVPNVTYTARAYDIANLGNPDFYIQWRYEDNTVGQSFASPNGFLSVSRVFPTDKMWFAIAPGSSTIDSRLEYIKKNIAIQIERSPTSTLYEPYKETSLYLTSPELRSNGTVKDEIRKGANGYELVKRINEVDRTVLTTPVISPISHGGILNSAENGTVYHEPILADAGVYDTKIDVLLIDYPIASIEEIIKHEGGVNTYLNASTAVIASDGLSFTHADLADGDLVLFTYAYSKESTNGNITASFYDSNVVKIDTVTGKAYKINEVVTNGVLTRTLIEV